LYLLSSSQTFAHLWWADLENENHFQDALRAKALQSYGEPRGQKPDKQL
jgi:hypothetical protein